MQTRTRYYESRNEPDWDSLNRAYDHYQAGRFEMALADFVALSKRGSHLAPIYIARMYENGVGVNQDRSEAFNWYQSPAKEGSATAQFLLGRLQRENGDLKEALMWNRRAAAQGFAPAMFAAYEMYEAGEGAPRNPELADQFLLDAARLGHVFAQKHRAIRQLKGYYGIFGRLIGPFAFIKAIVRGIWLYTRGRELDLLY